MSVATKSKPEKIDAEQLEEVRLGHRRSHKRLLAERQQLTRKAELILDRVRSLDAKRESAAGVHQETTAPVQAELKQLEDQITTLVMDRKPITDKLETRRRELMEAVMDANRVLEDAVQSISREQDKLRGEAAEFQKGSGEATVLENELCSHPLANPAWVLEQYSVGQALHFLDMRCAAARERLELCRQRNAEAGNYVQDARDGFARHLAKAEFEYAAASAESAAVSRRGRELREAMLDE